MMHQDPIAFFLTWVTYGTWLPGDSRGWVEYKRGWKLPDWVRELEAAAKMSENACILNREQRNAVENQIAETCEYRGWELNAVNCRSNHVHVVVSVFEVSPKKIRTDLKAWTTRRLKHYDSSRSAWWAERGSIRWIYDDNSLESAIAYTLDAQDQKGRG